MLQPCNFGNMMIRRALAQHTGERRWDLVLRITASAQLRGSPRLCELLLYLADCALRNSPEEVTEQQIGMQVFGRPAGFNSSEDSIVRTQVRLLRQKIGAYFAAEGAAESLVVDIPKGHYLPVFRTVTPALTAAASLHADPSLIELNPATSPLGIVAETPGAAPAASLTTSGLSITSPAPLPLKPAPLPLEKKPFKKPSPRLLLPLAVFAVIAVASALFLVLRSPAGKDMGPVLTLWRPFLTEEPPLVIYSNALFEGDSRTGLRYSTSDAPQQQPLPPHLVDHYTGVGEVVSVFEITRLFDSQKATFTLKRSRLVTWDEAKLRNLIFIGAPSENSSMRVLPPASDFTMTSGDGFASIVNQHPLKGEPAQLSRPEYPLTRDYAIVALLPGVEPGRHTLVLSGLTTLGTEAAAEFACRPDSVAQLFKAIGYTTGDVRLFEAVLEVNVGGGVPLQSRIVMAHVH